MPLYEYQCDACGHRFEKIQKYSDPLQDTCPKCGGPVHKLMSSPAFQFKGSGFYITDYAKKDHVDAAKADSALGELAAKSESSGKSDKSDKSGKSDKSDKSEKSGNTDSSQKSDKGTSGSSTTSSAGSGESSSSSPSATSKKADTSKPGTSNTGT